jgi:hypothetical protein
MSGEGAAAASDTSSKKTKERIGKGDPDPNRGLMRKVKVGVIALAAALAAVVALATVSWQKPNGHVSLLALPAGSALVSTELGRLVDEGVAEKLAEAWRSEQRAAASLRAAAHMHTLPPPPSETSALASGQSLFARALAQPRPAGQQLATTAAGQLAWEDKLEALLLKKEEAKLQAEEEDKEQKEAQKRALLLAQLSLHAAPAAPAHHARAAAVRVAALEGAVPHARTAMPQV